tara:strand:- start:2013 stop:2696 length:684 start_codon:yes stop_codon:yes gene_type:complete
MQEFNLLEEYPVLDKPRYISEDQRTIDHRIISSAREKDFFDGDRNFGYGGFKYDGRWKKIAEKIIKRYGLNKKSKILQINCEKGFFIYDITSIIPEIDAYGLETSEYAYSNSINPEVKKKIKFVDDYRKLNFEDNFFDFILCIGVVYTLNLPDIIKFLKEIVRVGKNNSFINLASYENENDFWLMKNWSLLGTTILKKDEWKKILEYTNYQGDYSFTNSHSLNIKRK